MTCHEVQVNLSLYLYNELDFSQEEQLEEHLSECALCKRALDREKAWHSSLNAEQAGVPLELLSECRRDLKTAISSPAKEIKGHLLNWSNWLSQLWIPNSAWSMRVAFASFLVFAGFTAGRWMTRGSSPFTLNGNALSEAGLLGSGAAHIRDIQPREDHRVRIIVDRVNEQEITGRPDDRVVRELLVAAAKDSSDPGIRVDSVEMLNGENGTDVRDALIYAVRQDANAGVRLKALEGLRRFTADPVTRESLALVLKNDDNPAVRSEAIDVLVPAAAQTQVGPELAGTLQEIIRSEQGDDYVRLRCMQILQQMKLSPDIY
jgi:hypothetical protein